MLNSTAKTPSSNGTYTHLLAKVLKPKVRPRGGANPIAAMAYRERVRKEEEQRTRAEALHMFMDMIGESGSDGGKHDDELPDTWEETPEAPMPPTAPPSPR